MEHEQSADGPHNAERLEEAADETFAFCARKSFQLREVLDAIGVVLNRASPEEQRLVGVAKSLLDEMDEKIIALTSKCEKV